jgi:uncharacterized repeat protein (TIGR02543 family)
LNRLLTLVLLLALFSGILDAQIYVSPSGLDTNPGTIDFPFKTLARALTAAGPDSLIYLRAGTYAKSTTETISKSGLDGLRIKIWAYPGEVPLFDFSSQTGTSADGIKLTASYCHLKGLEIIGAAHNGLNVSGHYNIIENCQIHDNRNSGYQMGSSSSTADPRGNLILNVDSYRNYDAPIGGNADGFAIKWNIGSGNIFKGCRAYNNSDDGWDLWMADSSIVMDSCSAFRNGVDSWGSGQFNGNGNGFKLGGNFIATQHTTRNCYSFDNAGNTGRGFDENNNTAGQTLFNCTAYRNQGDNYHFVNTVVLGAHEIRNCISYLGAVNITSGTRTNNSWQGFTVTAGDFLSLDTAQARYPRNPDGSLPNIDFVHLAPGSSMIDAGTNVGIPFNGSAPDLGAFETGGTTSYSLVVIAVNGSVQKNPNLVSYAPGTPVVLTAVPSPGYHFVGWSGSLTGTENPDTLLMDGNKSITATFALNQFTLSVSGVNGSIARNPDLSLYDSGSVVQLSANPATGYHFTVWGGDLSGGLSPATIQMNGNRTVTASFAIDEFTITATAGSHGTIDPAGDIVLQYGMSQRFTFNPDPGHYADSVIVDGAPVDSAAGYTFHSVTADHMIRVTFAPIPPPTYHLTVVADGGTVLRDPDLPVYTSGTIVQLTANPAVGRHFSQWSGDATGTLNPVSVTMDADRTVTANFDYDTLLITATAGPNGSVTPSGIVPVEYGSSHRFDFFAAPGYYVDTILVDGIPVQDSISGYTFAGVTTPHTLYVGFAEAAGMVTVRAGWNIVSVPSIVQDGGTVVLFPTATGGAFEFVPGAGYEFRDTLTHGAGYWMKFSTAQNVRIAGLPVAQDTIAVSAGWNLIGTISTPLNIASILQVPEGIVQSRFYGYEDQLTAVDQLLPGKGYWVKVTSPGILILQP